MKNEANFLCSEVLLFQRDILLETLKAFAAK
jgi:hypothetical protein